MESFQSQSEPTNNLGLTTTNALIAHSVTVDLSWKAGHVAVAEAGDLTGPRGWPRASRNCEGHYCVFCFVSYLMVNKVVY